LARQEIPYFIVNYFIVPASRIGDNESTIGATTRWHAATSAFLFRFKSMLR
jgi:hypothetical protein